MANVTQNIVTDKKAVKDQLGGTPDVAPVFKRFTHRFITRHIATKYVQREYDGSNNVYILGNNTYGVLGSNRLGNNGASTDTLYAVVPPNNTFWEFFYVNTFIDTGATTATVDNSAGEVTMTNGDVLQSEVITKLREPIVSIKLLEHDDLKQVEGGMTLGTLELDITTFKDENVDIRVSNDGGATWETIDAEGKVHTFSSSSTGDELKYQIEAYDSITISDPIVFKINP